MAEQRQWEVVVVGGANTDYLVQGPKLPGPRETVQGDVFQEGPGGKGANQAVAAARLGARVAVVARVGADGRGGELVARLAAEGVEVSHVVRDAGAPTGAALIQVDSDGEKQILVAPGANRNLTPADVGAARKAIAATRVLLVQLEVPLETVAVAIRLAGQTGARVVLDPAPPIPLPDELLRRVDVIRPNADEAEVLTGRQVRDRASARLAAQELLRRGVGAVAVQAGDEGNLLVWREGECWMPQLPVESVDATGAGDAFAAAMAVALADGWSWEEAGPFANAAAALATTKLGAQPGLPRRDAVLALLAQGDTKDRGGP